MEKSIGKMVGEALALAEAQGMCAMRENPDLPDWFRSAMSQPKMAESLLLKEDAGVDDWLEKETDQCGLKGKLQTEFLFTNCLDSAVALRAMEVELNVIRGQRLTSEAELATAESAVNEHNRRVARAQLELTTAQTKQAAAGEIVLHWRAIIAEPLAALLTEASAANAELAGVHSSFIAVANNEEFGDRTGLTTAAAFLGSHSDARAHYESRVHAGAIAVSLTQAEADEINTEVSTQAFQSNATEIANDSALLAARDYRKKAIGSAGFNFKERFDELLLRYTRERQIVRILINALVSSVRATPYHLVTPNEDLDKLMEFASDVSTAIGAAADGILARLLNFDFLIKRLSINTTTVSKGAVVKMTTSLGEGVKGELELEAPDRAMFRFLTVAGVGSEPLFNLRIRASSAATHGTLGVVPRLGDAQSGSICAAHWWNMFAGGKYEFEAEGEPTNLVVTVQYDVFNENMILH